MKSPFIFFFSLFTLLSACGQQNAQVTKTESKEMADRASMGPSEPTYKYAPPAEVGVVEPFDTTDAYWREELNEVEYHVLRKEGTERSFTGAFWDNKKPGIYTCGGCGLPLFSSSTKFRSGTGWPSYYEPIHPSYIGEEVDNRYGMRRVEVHCARCGGHQGH
ncbi:MAG: peptide-methionine (R)-S-oxide reductase MsrB, partial [Bacteroidota bacterium]